MTVSWRLRRVSDGHIEQPLTGGTLIDAINRFAREANPVIDDADEDSAAAWSSRTAVELEYAIPDLGIDWTRRFGGFVVETDDRDQQLEIACLSYDAYLRNRTVNRGYTATPISDILEDLITDDDLTPVKWELGNVTVPNDVQLDRVYEGEPLDEVLEELAIIGTTGERAEWGANNDAEVPET